MKNMKKRCFSFILVLSLLLSAWSPVGTGYVSATGFDETNGNISLETTEERGSVSGDGTEDSTEESAAYTIVFVNEENEEIDKEITLSANATLQLIPRVKDRNGIYITSAQFGYSTSDKQIAAVSETGFVTVQAVSEESTAEITVTWKSDTEPVQTAQAVYRINVKTVPVESVSLEKDKKTLILNETYGLTPVVSPSEAAQDVAYTVQDDGIVSVSGDGTVTALAEGTTVVTVYAKSDETKKDTIEITVIDFPVSVEFEQSVYTVREKEYVIVNAQLVYVSGKKIPVDNSELKFISQNEVLVTVDATGTVTAKDIDEFPQTAIVSATYSASYEDDGEMIIKDVSGICEVTVISIPVTEIRLDNEVKSITMKIGEEYRLKWTILPENASIQDVVFTSSDSNIAKVGKAGKITAQSIGDAIITVSSKGNPEIKTEFKVKVYQTEFNVAELGANGTDTKTDHSAINKILKYAELIDETITVIVPDGVYYIGKALTVYSDTNICLADNAEIRRQKSQGGDVMLCTKIDESIGGYNQVENINITGGVWNGQGNGQTDENNIDANLFYFGHAQNITITNTKIINCTGSHLIEFAGVKNALVENVELYGYTICKAKTYSGWDEDKEAIQLDYCGSVSTPRMKPHDGTPCENITIRNCSIHDYMAGIGTHTAGSRASTNIRIENNTFKNIANACVNLVNFKNVTITGNTAENCTTFLYASVSQGTMSDNKVKNGTSYSPTIKNSSKLRAKNGITISNSSNFTITKNTFEKAKSNGICIWNNSTAVIKNNKIKGNKLYGIRTQGSTVTLKKNTLSSNKKGVYDTYKDATVKSSDDIRAYYIDIKSSYQYTGYAIKPTVKIKGLKKKYYKVSYKNNKKPGTATITIKGKGKVKKTLKVKFKIKK